MSRPDGSRSIGRTYVPLHVGAASKMGMETGHVSAMICWEETNARSMQKAVLVEVQDSTILHYRMVHRKPGI